MIDTEPVESELVLMNLKQGDKVLIALRADLTPEAARGMREALRERFPDVEFTVLCDVVGIGCTHAGE